MLDKLQYLETSTEKYPFIYSLNVMRVLQETFGSLKEWAKLIEPKDGSEPNLQALIIFFKEAINDGIDEENERTGSNRLFITERKAGRIITEVGTKNAAKALKEATISATPTDDEPKNQTTTQNQIPTL